MWLAPAAVVAWKVLSDLQRKLLVLFIALAGVWMTISRLIE
jgi:hypothetical protein